MNAELRNQSLAPRVARRHSQARHIVRFTGIGMVLFASLLSARGADPNIDPNYPMDACASLGATVSLRIVASTAQYPLTFQWRHEGTNLPGANAYLLALANLAMPHAGGYCCVVSNAVGDSATSRVATVSLDLTFLKITSGEFVTNRASSVGGSWGDYDRDGYPDLYIVNDPGTANSLYRNNRDGTFTKVTANAATQLPSGSSATWGDFDNDEDLDLFVVATGTARDNLIRNEGGGSFLKMPVAPGGPTEDVQLTYTASWADADRDGWLDLFVACYGGQGDRLYRNLGNGTFRRLTSAEAGDAVADASNTAGGVWGDYDNDGAPDLFVLTYETSGHALYHNDGKGRLMRVPAADFPRLSGSYRAAAWGDYDNDGDLDLFEVGFNVRNALYQNRGDGTFTNLAQYVGLGTILPNAFGAAWGDYENDGDLDLFVTSYDGKNALYRNQGDGTFASIEVRNPLVDGAGRVDVGWVDYNRDGFLDLFIGCQNSPCQLYQNNLKASGSTNHWLEVRLKGTASNVSAIGAKVRVRASIGGAEVWQLRQVESQFITHDLVLHFGLGDATNAEIVRIEWPSGNVQERSNVPPDQVVYMTEQTFITPVRPTGSLGSSVRLGSQRYNGNWQWYHEGVALEGCTNITLLFTNLAAADAGRYSVVVDTGNGLVTNYAYLFVDTQFTKITTGQVVTDIEDSWGSVWVDYDQDGDVDLFVANGLFNGGRNALYRNDGSGSFTRMTAATAGTIANEPGSWGQAAWADYDNDGFPDGMVVGRTGTALYHNLGNGMFERRLDLVPASWPSGPGPCFADFDNDGWVDCFISTAVSDNLYVRTNTLLHNEGGKGFRRVTQGPIVRDYLQNTLAGNWGDYDGDGDLDLVITLGEAGGVRLYENLGGGAFQRAQTTGLEGSLGSGAIPVEAVWADYDNDRVLDLFAAVYGGSATNVLFHNQGNGVFTRSLMGFAGEQGHPDWADYDNDGWLDLFLARGQGGAANSQLWHNNGDGTFSPVTMGSLVTDLGRSQGSAWGDYDNDGFMDLFVARGYVSGTNALYHNNPNGNHWLKVKLVGTTSNRSAIGAKVKVLAAINGRTFWQMREVPGGNRCQDDLRPNFGLGNARNVLTLRIEWPSGTIQEFNNVSADQIVVVTEPRRPVLAISATTPQVEGTVTGDPNLTYKIEMSDDLTAGWIALPNVTTDANGKATWSDPNPAAQGRRFYKASGL